MLDSSPTTSKNIISPPHTENIEEISEFIDFKLDERKIVISATITIFNIIFQPKYIIFAFFNKDQTASLW